MAVLSVKLDLSQPYLPQYCMGLEIIRIQKRIICPPSQYSAHGLGSTTNLAAHKVRIDSVQSTFVYYALPVWS
jgi:hypothetical protein